MSVPRFAIVGHPNKGKSSIVATLAEDDAVAISPHPGHHHAGAHVPDATRRQGSLRAHRHTGLSARARSARVARSARPWRGRTRRRRRANSCKRTRATRASTTSASYSRPIVAGAGILYVVDGSRPYGRQYEAEMEILRWTGRPRMALINLIAAGDHVEQWRAALGQYFSIVRVFDAVRADFGKRIELLRAFGAIDERWAAPLNVAADALVADRKRRAHRAAAEIADLLVSGADRDGDRAAREPQRGTRSAGARRRARQAARPGACRARLRRDGAVQEIYHHDGLEARESAAAYLVEDVFSAQSFNVFGLSQTQLAVTGAASGAVVGGAVDVALGGASLLLGAGIGAVLGAFGTLASAGSLAKVRVLGLPLGGYELSVGPITDPNLPWVLLGRALAARKARRRTQSRASRRARRRRASRRTSRGQHRWCAAPQARRRVPQPARRARQSQPTSATALIAELAALIDPRSVEAT